MLFWESEHPGYGEVHHLMVLCYHLQHPSLYSPEGLKLGRHLLEEFVERGARPEDVRRRERGRVDSSRRAWKIKGTPAARGAYDPPMRWAMTAADVTAVGVEKYPDSARAWARSVHEAFGNAPD
jgi:hypothetical protein